MSDSPAGVGSVPGAGSGGKGVPVMSRFVLLVVGFGWLLMGMVLAQQLPPGYQYVIQITNDNTYNQDPAMNNRGQFVFSKRFNPTNWETSEIFLYDIATSELTRLTDDNVADRFPEINDAGEIVWSRRMVPGAMFEIVLYHDGELTRLTYDSLDDRSPQINNSGLIAWNKFTEQGCAEADSDIYVYDGQCIAQVPFDLGYSNQCECLNDLGDLVWTRFNFCNEPWTAWTAEILLYSEGFLTPLTGNDEQPQLPRINNNRVVAWQHNAPGWNKHIRMWENGVTTVLTDWGGGLRLNNRGDVVFNRWHDDSSTWQVWLYLKHTGEFYPITDDPFWNRTADINDHGDIAWMSGPTFDADIILLKRFPAGDLNCDGAVDAFDIDPVVLALIDPSVYELTYPGCDYLLADFNADGEINAFDIDPFVEVLTP